MDGTPKDQQEPRAEEDAGAQAGPAEAASGQDVDDGAEAGARSEKAGDGAKEAPATESENVEPGEGAQRPNADEVRMIRDLLARLQAMALSSGQDAPTVQLSPEDVRLLGNLVSRGIIRAHTAGTQAPAKEERDVMSALKFTSMLNKLRGDNHWEGNLVFKDLSYTVKVPKGSIGIRTVGNTCTQVLAPLLRVFNGCKTAAEEIKVLDNVTGAFLAGRPTLVLGPPGCGVSTLFKALSGRLVRDSTHVLEGQRLYSGLTEHEVGIRKLASYIEQMDQHIPVLTVRETVEFAFACRNGASIVTLASEDQDMSATEIEAVKAQSAHFPDYVISHFGLTNCEDTIVGNEMLRGVSGGERKRVTSAEMLMPRRPVLFFDQISTGLDSAATFDISRILCNAAHDLDLTMVVALLQPPPEVFDLFDEILVLARGMVMFHGPRAEVLPYFESIGYRCPDNKDIADFLQEVTTDMCKAYRFRDGPDVPKNEREMAASWLASPFSEAKRGEVEAWVSGARKAERNAFFEKRFSAAAPSFALPLARDAMIVLARQKKLFIRNKPFIFARLFQATFMGLVYGTVFVQLGGTLTLENITQRYGVIFVTMMQAMLGGMASIGDVVAARPVLYKQQDALFFRTLSYSIAELVVGIPLVIVEAIIMGTLVFWSTNLVPIDAPDVGTQYLFFMWVLVWLQISFSGVLRVAASLATSTAIGQTFAGVILVFCVLFNGFIIPFSNIPPWFIWIYWINPFAWGYRAVLVSVFSSPAFGEQGRIALETFAVPSNPEFVWAGFGYLVGSTLINFAVGWLVYANVRIGSSAGRAGPGRTETGEDADVDEAAELILLDQENDNDDVEAAARRTKLHVVREESRTIMSDNFLRVNLAFRNLWYSVPNPAKKGSTIDLLKGISGFFESGKMTALMGSSGAGKSTLMDVLAGLKTGGTISGDVLVNGRPKDPISFPRLMGYCEQSDVHSPHTTVREAVHFSANLRQDSSVSAEAKRNFAEAVLDTLELASIADFEVGIKGGGGLSTEQMKRLTIAVELAANPSIVFADEPTSGLDARAAAIVMRGIKRVAAVGRTVVCTIHQPNKDIFFEFDRLLLLKRGGRPVYFGDLGHESAALLAYLQGIPGTAPMASSRVNPATYMLDVIGAGVGGAAQVVDYAFEYAESEQRRTMEAALERLVEADLDAAKEATFDTLFASTFGTQLRELVCKWIRTYWRSPAYNLSRFVVNIFMGLLFGVAFLRGGRLESTQDVQSLLGVIFLAVTFLGVISNTTTIPVLFGERGPFYRERAAHMYAVTPYVIAYTVAEIPYILVASLLFMVCFYFTVELNMEASAFFLFWFTFFMYNTAQTLFGQMLASLLPSNQVASIVSGLTTGLMSLSAGFTIAVSDIPVFWQFLPAINPLRYAFGALVQIQLTCNCTVDYVPNGTLTCSGGQPCASACDALSPGCAIITVTWPNGTQLPTTASKYAEGIYSLNYDDTALYISALVIFVVIFRLCMALGLTYVSYLKR